MDEQIFAIFVPRHNIRDRHWCKNESNKSNCVRLPSDMNCWRVKQDKLPSGVHSTRPTHTVIRRTSFFPVSSLKSVNEKQRRTKSHLWSIQLAIASSRE